MPLPAIAPYDLPDTGLLPPRRAGWAPDPQRAVLLIHDMQEYFVSAFDGAPMPEVVENVRALRDACDQMGIPVILSAQPPRQAPERRGLLTDLWGPGIATDEEAAVIAPLAPRDSDVEMVKWRYSAFVRTDLADQMRRLGRDQLIITGIYAHIGCMLTAADAFMRDLSPFLAADAVADFSRAEHLHTIGYVNSTCGASLTTAEIVKDLTGTPPTTT
ncbi:isochorismatase family protein [Gordonia sp. ABSL1-1]|uniref:isochorismatase family protein n=1 Tax=Gordonia sp. ABSL1-1 TaxID=3053923 RepID=UPI002573FEF3|nr:isochorismatase family protein [Gordonia sp. ABSL1-1]MDL9938977.1 isochorismatase family protein [Gordonia sp. ABSL1-1]